MSFLLRKKTFKFDVQLEVEELDSVPLVSGVLFAKVRLLDGGTKFMWVTPREEVTSHVVQWKKSIRFTMKMSASPLTGVLDKCICRVSVRKELKGGKSFQKLGFVDINLSEFAGAGFTSERYLLEGYDSKRRLDNSVLKVNVYMMLVSGDPCFKVPRSVRSVRSFSGESVEDTELHPGNKGVCDDYNSDSLTSRSSGFGSLPRREPSDSSLKKPAEIDREVRAPVKPRTCDDISLSFSKSQYSFDSSISDAFQRSFSVNYQVSTNNFARHFNSGLSTRRHKPTDCAYGCSRTRNDNQLVEELIQETNCRTDEMLEETLIQLFVTKDGRTLVNSASSNDMQPSSSSHRRVSSDS